MGALTTRENSTASSSHWGPVGPPAPTISKNPDQIDPLRVYDLVVDEPRAPSTVVLCSD